MNIVINNRPTDVAPDASLEQLAAQLDLLPLGVAVAVNNKMVPRTEWSGYHLSENDQIVIIKAACGG